MSRASTLFPKLLLCALLLSFVMALSACRPNLSNSDVAALPTPQAENDLRLTVQDDFERGRTAWKDFYGRNGWVGHSDVVLDQANGQPAPSLFLRGRNIDAGTCAIGGFLLLNNGHTFKNGTIDLDVKIGEGGLVDLLFRGDVYERKGYIARLDARGSLDPDTLLRVDGIWLFTGSRNQRSATVNQWHHMKVRADGPRLEVLQDDQLVAWAINTDYTQGRIAIFNECGDVRIDNVVVKEWP